MNTCYTSHQAVSQRGYCHAGWYLLHQLQGVDMPADAVQQLACSQKHPVHAMAYGRGP